MNRRFTTLSCVLSLAVISTWSGVARGDEAAKPQAADTTPPAAAATTPAATPAAATPAAKPASKYPAYADVVKDFESIDGLVPMKRKGNRLLAELSSSHMNHDYIVLISIAKGIGRGLVLGGMTWQSGDDWIWQFRKVDDRIQIVRRNVRFTAAKGDPQSKAIDTAYTDSVLFSLPILTVSPSGASVVDFSPVFMSDLPQISSVLPGFSFSENKSTWAAVKGFPNNIELEVAATYASSGMQDIDSIADSRGATINVHYSISAVPQTGYQPRLADDRVGYFLTVVKDWSRKSDDDRFVRYITRWDLQKADSTAELSPPKKPIIFYLEKTIPFIYRKPIREGIAEWNKAFEKAGFANAIEVRQQEDKDDWDPEDIRYNTFRWITSGAGFAMGPSRVNPNTGQILDADVIFDADFLQFWKQEYENFTPESVAAMTGGPLDLKSYQEESRKLGHRHGIGCELSHGLGRELAFGSAVLSARTSSPAEREKLIMQGLKEVTMHEIGHTLGLRHNFKSSTMLTIDEMNDTAKTRDTGLTGSVMDYAPANIMPKDLAQGDYFSATIGPYDYWAIEYGYKPFSGGTEGEVAELKKIAARSADPTLAYATDEDTRGIDPDPLSNRYDMGKDPIAYAKIRAQLIAEQWPKVIEETAKPGEGYQKVRQVFGVLLGNHGRAMHFVSRFVGGVYVSRARQGRCQRQGPLRRGRAGQAARGAGAGRRPGVQRQAVQFSARALRIPGLDALVALGFAASLAPDFPVHEVISMWQDRILAQILSPLTLERLHDTELQLPPDQDALTTPELLHRLTSAIFSEVDKMPEADYTNRKPAISSLRRNLQRSYLKRLSNLAMGDSGAPKIAKPSPTPSWRGSRAASTTCSRRTRSWTPTVGPISRNPPAGSTKCSTRG